MVIVFKAIPVAMFNALRNSKVKKFILTCKEINLSFVPYDERIFSLDSSDLFQFIYSPLLHDHFMYSLDRISEQLATLCVTLKEYPKIRFYTRNILNLKLAEIFQKKLESYKKDEPTMGEGLEKSKTQLIILDRGFDCISPLLHELTIQAMSYDILPIENDIYKFSQTNNGKTKEIYLNENDSLWIDIRHEHIANTPQIIDKKFAKTKKLIFGDSNNKSDKHSLHNLSKLIKNMPQYQKELLMFEKNLQITNDCMGKFKNYLDFICSVEQDLATGVNKDGEKIKDQLKNVIQILLDHVSFIYTVLK